MKRTYFPLLTIAIILGNLPTAPSTFAGGTGGEYAQSIPRYNVVNPTLYRHYEDTRRYNAAPNRYGYKDKSAKSYLPAYSSCSTRCVEAEPFKIRTDVVSRRTQQVVYYDSCGRRLCRNQTVTMYKDVFSNGGCRIWQHIAHSP